MSNIFINSWMNLVNWLASGLENPVATPKTSTVYAPIKGPETVVVKKKGGQVWKVTYWSRAGNLRVARVTGYNPNTDRWLLTRRHGAPFTRRAHLRPIAA